MSEQDDWARFREMMEREGWTVREGPLPAFDHETATYFANDGMLIKLVNGAPRPSFVGTWREWLAAGTGPVPF